ncbi:hypothetical protein BH09PAT4_BH09PAT4_04730 [soil metagenome]
MYAIFLDGESKTGKTTVGSAIEADLAKDYHVLRTLSGSFFRRLTVAALDLRGGDYDSTDQEWLEGAVAQVIDSRIAYDESKDWSAIHSKEVDDLVSVLGQLQIAQDAAKEWWPLMGDAALKQGVEVLIVDGRNPRAKSAKWRAEHDVPIALDLCVYCDPDVAAKRYVYSQGATDPTPAQLAEARAQIVQRRELDRNRAAAPYIEPADQVDFDSGVSDETETVEESFAADVVDPPRVIRFDTTHSPLEITQVTAGALARAAIRRLNK